MQAQLIEPDGTENVVVSVDYAIEYCKNHPGWSWKNYEESHRDSDWD